MCINNSSFGRADRARRSQLQVHTQTNRAQQSPQIGVVDSNQQHTRAVLHQAHIITQHHPLTSAQPSRNATQLRPLMGAAESALPITLPRHRCSPAHVPQCMGPKTQVPKGWVKGPKPASTHSTPNALPEGLTTDALEMNMACGRPKLCSMWPPCCAQCAQLWPHRHGECTWRPCILPCRRLVCLSRTAPPPRIQHKQFGVIRCETYIKGSSHYRQHTPSCKGGRPLPLQKHQCRSTTPQRGKIGQMQDYETSTDLVCDM